MKNKLFVSIVIAFCAVAFGASNALADTVSVSNASGTVGQNSVSVSISASSITTANVTSIDLRLLYNSSTLTVVSVSAGSGVPSGWTLLSNAQTSGTVSAALYGTTALPPQSGQILNIVFGVKSQATTGSTALDLTRAFLNETIATMQDGTFTVTTPTTAPPVLQAIGNKQVNEGTLLEFTISATDSDSTALTYSASNLPQGATFDVAAKRFSWTPGYIQSGTHSNVHFAVSDGSLSDTEDITITVADVDAPSLAVTISATPSSGVAPLSSVSLIATVTGSATGNINYTFYCDRSDAGTDITTPYTSKIDNQGAITKSTICAYINVGTYSPKVIVERGSYQAESRVVVTVTATATPPPATTPPATTPPATTPPVTTPPATTPPSTTPPPGSDDALIAALQAQIAELLRQITAIQALLAARDIPANYRFTKVLMFGQVSNDVKYLQMFLKAQGAEIYPSGLVTNRFGALTRAAVIRFQEKYRQEILAPVGFSAGTGIVAGRTNTKINQLLGR